jgi:hypothetical protein
MQGVHLPVEKVDSKDVSRRALYRVSSADIDIVDVKLTRARSEPHAFPRPVVKTRGSVVCDI